MATEITLIRHGQSVWNACHRAQGQALVPLTNLGQRQVSALAGAFAGRNGFAALYASDLMRCKQTAEPLAAALNMPIHFDRRLREIDVGMWQGMGFDEISTLDSARWQAFKTDPVNVCIPDGENHRMLRQRVIACLLEIVRAHTGEHVLVVLHGGPIYETLRHYHLMDAPPYSGEEPALWNTSRTVLRVAMDGRTAELIAFADCSHLTDELRA